MSLPVVLRCLLLSCLWSTLLPAAERAPAGGAPSGQAIAGDSRSDCNGNGIPDDQDIAEGTSEDCNDNGVPDECDIDPADPDGNGEVSEDCAPHNCCQTGHGPGCSDPYIRDCVCAIEPWGPQCCVYAWDDYCVGLLENENYGCGICGNGIPDECEPDCNGNGVPDGCDIVQGTSVDCVPHNCCRLGHGPGCSDPDIEVCVCDQDLSLIHISEPTRPY